ncbi:alpha-2,8-sialyltransferase 8F isoform X2 [Myripristis murdjan]|uniref:ST8 alpha-N-acetyl-neuraminide alpha-2,8-sialyltransferase 6 n=1 Tax=Myripristis murdjan TaxID=586833 RepID=A0A667Z9A3_9TELE|nr:alpha-2,8-sialyltransferase 8F-like isoform X2 [Myripristis murdjan]
MKKLFLSFFALVVLVFWLMLNTFVWHDFSNSDKGPQGPYHHVQRRIGSGNSAPCEDCSRITDQVVEHFTHSMKKQEDNLENLRKTITDKVEQHSSDNLGEQDNKVIKLRNNITDKVVKPYTQNLKKQEDNVNKLSNNADKPAERPPDNLKKQEDNVKSNVGPQGPYQHAPKKIASGASTPCKDCSEQIIDNIMERYNHSWKRQEENVKVLRSLLNSSCSGLTKAIVTQANTPVGSEVTYDGEKRKPYKVPQQVFDVFPKDHPFLNKPLDTCAVIGNGGVLANSSCGERIDSAQFVFRCNLPPVTDGYEKDVGSKTNLVTVNPSIILFKYKNLMERHRPFVESLNVYGDSLVLLPAFSYAFNTPVSLRVLYAIQDFKSPTQPVFLNPDYLRSLNQFWRSQGLKESRLSTGLMMVSLALEVCSRVDLYGFWPFSLHPYGHQPLTNHYYDDVQFKKRVHTMPAEFEQLLKLHNQGVLRVQLGKCPPDTR